MPVNDFGVLAWAFSNVPVDNPADPQSTFSEHTDCVYRFFVSLLPSVIAHTLFSRFLWHGLHHLSRRRYYLCQLPQGSIWSGQHSFQHSVVHAFWHITHGRSKRLRE